MVKLVSPDTSLKVALALREAGLQVFPAKYKDDYKEALLGVIEKKVAAGGKDLAKPKKTKGVKATNVIDLVAVLQKSIQEHGSHRAKKTTRPKARRKAA